jgi:hypothetical protein
MLENMGNPGGISRWGSEIYREQVVGIGSRKMHEPGSGCVVGQLPVSEVQFGNFSDAVDGKTGYGGTDRDNLLHNSGHPSTRLISR